MTVSDLPQRQQALDIGGSYIVQAPAGSGKTGVLTLRILRLLTLVDSPEEILAITFTKKAAAEMRVRVMEALDLAAQQNPPDSEYELQFYQLGKQVLQRDADKAWGLQQNQNRLRLLTIDSFCNGVVKNRPLASGLGVQFAIAEDGSDLYQEASRALLGSLDQDDSLGIALRRVLGQLDNQFSKLSALVSQMLSQRDHWLGDVSNVHGDMDSFRALLEQSLFNLNKDALATVKENFNPDFFPQLDNIAVYAENQLHLQKLEHDILAVEPASFEHQKEKLKLLLTAKLEPRSRLDKNGGFPSGGSAAEKKEATAYKEQAKDLIAQIERSGLPGLTSIQDFINLPDESLTEHQWQLLEDLVLIMRYAAAHLKVVFQTQHSVDFSEVALAALATLGTADDPSDLTLLLDNKISHILVDEFQDTSFIQVELLDRLTAGWEQGDGRTLFLVGDPMQSIYAFRKADVGLFIRLWHQRQLGQVKLTPLILSTNFRSSVTIIDWVNKVFSQAFPAKADIRKGAVTYAHSSANRSALPQDRVQLQLFAHGEKQRDSADLAEAKWIADTITKSNPEQSVAVLVKGKAHVARIVTELKAAGIAYQAVDIESLAQSQVITDLLSAARAYLSPSDKTAWFALLRGPWCGLTLAELQALVDTALDPWAALKSLNDRPLGEKKVGSRFSPLTLSKLKHIYTTFSKVYADRHCFRWQDSLRELVLNLGIPASCSTVAELESIDLFFELLDSVDCIADVPDFSVLMRKLDDLFVPPEVYPADRQVVQVMTMHKSKGLEYDVVFLPQLHRRPRGDDKPLILLDKQTAIANESQELFLAPLENKRENKSTAKDNSVYRYLWQLNRQRAQNESARLLYVACTRAKQQLYLSGCLEKKDADFKKPESSALLSLVFPIREQFNAQVTEVIARDAVSSATSFRSASAEFIAGIANGMRPQGARLADSFSFESQDIGDEHTKQYRRHAGTLTHRILEQLSRNPGRFGQIDPKQMESQWLQELQRLGVGEANLNEALGVVQRAIATIQASDQGRWLFGTKHQADFAELSLVHCQDDQTAKSVIVDRTFVEAGTRIIIDYKLSEPEGDMAAFIQQEMTQYTPQLVSYREAMNALDPMPTKLYLYFPLMDHLQEVAQPCQ